MSLSAPDLPANPFERLWLIGCGSMGGALLDRWLQSGLPADAVTVIDPEPGGLPAGFSGAVVADMDEAGRTSAGPTAVVLAVKPQSLAAVATGLQPWLISPPLLVSMLAGVRTTTLAQLFPAARLLRIMPNMPARIGRGITALYGAGLADGDGPASERLMQAAGRVVWLDDESRFDAVTALSGSGPAFLFRFIEAMTGAGEAAGLDAEIAATLALETVAGAAALAAQADQSPALLRQQVTSPQGTTQAGLDVLDGDGALSSLMRATIRASAERSRALAAAADAVAEFALARDPARVG